MLIDRFLHEYDHNEIHRIEVEAPASVVYEALWSTDIARSPIIGALVGLRSLPKRLSGAPTKGQGDSAPSFNLEALLRNGFGLLAEEKDKELVVGVSGRFWRPVDNLLPFRREDFDGPVAPGTARGVWNFHLGDAGPGRTLLTTETRVACGDAASRRKFAAYWFFVRPFSGLIRIVMLRSVARECERRSAHP